MFVHMNMFEHIIEEFALGSTVFEPIVFSDMFGATECVLSSLTKL